MTRVMEVGFSPCPNDTFMFHGLVSGLVQVDDFMFVPHLADIEELNRRAVTGDQPLPVTKVSVPALARALDRYAVLPAGAAMTLKPDFIDNRHGIFQPHRIRPDCRSSFARAGGTAALGCRPSHRRAAPCGGQEPLSRKRQGHGDRRQRPDR